MLKLSVGLNLDAWPNLNTYQTCVGIYLGYNNVFVVCVNNKTVIFLE